MQERYTRYLLSALQKFLRTRRNGCDAGRRARLHLDLQTLLRTRGNGRGPGVGERSYTRPVARLVNLTSQS